MNCAIHQQTPAAVYCRTCGKPLCESCKRDVHGIIYCEDCLASHVQATAPNAPPPVNPNVPNPGVAFVLGFLPGVGAMYCGELLRAFIHVAVFATLIVATTEANGIISGMFGMLIGFWVFYMAFDSYQIAKAKQEGRPVQDIFGFGTPAAASTSSTSTQTFSVPPMLDPVRSRNMPLGPIILIALGFLFLLHTIGLFQLSMKFWPLILIGIGGWMIWQRTQRVACRCVACTAVSLMGPVILVTLGVMFLLAEFTRVHFGESWPLILIVIGVLKFLQITGSRAGHIGPGVPPASTVPPPDNTAAPSSQNEVSHG